MANSLRLHLFMLPFQEVEKEQWNSLFLESGTENLFYHHSFITAAQQVWKEALPDSVVAGYEEDRLVLIQPIKIRYSLIGKTVELLHIPTADCIEPVALSSLRDEIVTELLTFIRDILKPDLLLARSLTEEFYQAVSQFFGEYPKRILGNAKGYFLEMPSTQEEFWGMYKSGFRNQLKRKIRKGEEAGLVFRNVDESHMPPGYDMEQALGNLTRLHKMRFDSMGRPSFFSAPDFQEFHKNLCTSLVESHCAVSFTEALYNGQVVASLYGVRTPQVFLYLMIGSDPALSSLSLGNLVIYKTMERLIEREVKKFDFKCGEEEYKERWTKNVYAKYSLCIPFNRKGHSIYAKILALQHFKKVKRLPGKLKRIIGKHRQASRTTSNL